MLNTLLIADALSNSYEYPAVMAFPKIFIFAYTIPRIMAKNKHIMLINIFHEIYFLLAINNAKKPGAIHTISEKRVKSAKAKKASDPTIYETRLLRKNFIKQ